MNCKHCGAEQESGWAGARKYKCGTIQYSNTEWKRTILCHRRHDKQRIADLEKLLRDLVVECDGNGWKDGDDCCPSTASIEETEAFKAARAAVPEETT